MDTLKFVIPGKPEYLTMIRLAISSIATTAGFDVGAIEDMKTAVSEACKNVSCHGFTGFSSQYEIECKVDEGSMEITVSDDCDEHTLSKMAKPCRDCPQEGNLGVYVIESLMTQVDFSQNEKGQKKIHMKKVI
ncbi:MAG: ATP-binding protein [Anaerovoracaceae bacterium]|jgi:serine/threonine-protein kinase RsbW